MTDMELPHIHRLSQQLRRPSGTRCGDCNESLIGPRSVCPACGSAKVQPVEFATTGGVITFTEVFHPPTAHEANTPYFLALVQLDDGSRVLAQLTDVRREEVQIGLRVESVFRRLVVDGDAGAILYGYKFRPVFCNGPSLS